MMPNICRSILFLLFYYTYTTEGSDPSNISLEVMGGRETRQGRHILVLGQARRVLIRGLTLTRGMQCFRIIKDLRKATKGCRLQDNDLKNSSIVTVRRKRKTLGVPKLRSTDARHEFGLRQAVNIFRNIMTFSKERI